MTAASPEPVGVQVCASCGQVRRLAAMVQHDDETWQCAAPCRRPGGRPAVGPPVLIRMPPELRAAIEALSLPGEKLAATARRLLGSAVAAASADQAAAARPFCRAPGSEGPVCPWLDEDEDEDQAAAPGQCPACSRWHPGWIPPACPLSKVGPPPALTLAPAPAPAAPRAAAAPAGYRPRQDGQEDSPFRGRGVLAEDRSGRPVVVGPVYSDKGVAAIRAAIEALPLWVPVGEVRMVTKAHFEEHGDGMWK